MNQSRLWLVVNPSVGLPLFLGGVVVMSLIVHFAILANTTWFPAFFNGSAETPVIVVAPPADPEPSS